MIARLRADAARIPLADGSVHCCVTSPPYFGLRRYAGVPDGAWGGDPAHAHVWGDALPAIKPGQVPQTKWAGVSAVSDGQRADTGRCCPCGAWRGCLGNEPTVDLYVAHLVAVFREVRRVLRDDGVLWLNLGDSFATAPVGRFNGGSALLAGRDLDGHADSGQDKTKSGVPAGNLLGVPWRVALALQADGWTLRNDVAWIKTSCMPESVSGWRWQRCRVKVDGGKRGERPSLTVARKNSAQSDHDGHDFAPSATWGDCPGCDKCAATDGMVLRRGAWRHTRAHEAVFMLTKGMDYYCDADAAKVPHKAESLARYDYGLRLRADGDAIKGSVHDRINAGLGNSERMADFIDPAGANPRSYMLLGPEPLRESHYAAFPTALVEPLIKVSTPGRGCCRACGTPWARMVERRAMVVARSERGEAQRNGETGNANGRTVTSGTMVEPPSSRTVGWRATCPCDAGEPVAATILDPFAGSGTVGRVAVQHGRRAVLCDLSQTYLRDIAASRVGRAALAGQVSRTGAATQADLW